MPLTFSVAGSLGFFFLCGRFFSVALKRLTWWWGHHSFYATTSGPSLLGGSCEWVSWLRDQVFGLTWSLGSHTREFCGAATGKHEKVHWVRPKSAGWRASYHLKILSRTLLSVIHLALSKGVVDCGKCVNFGSRYQKGYYMGLLNNDTN